MSPISSQSLFAVVRQIRPQYVWQICLVLFVALAVRLWGLNFGLPYAYHIDEPRYIFSAVGMWQDGTLNPGWFNQPTLYTYLIAVVLGVYYGFGRLLGAFVSTADLFRPPYHFDGFIPFPEEFLLARLLTVVLALATVWVVYRLGQQWLGQKGAVGAAAFLALSIFHVTSSHFIATDVPVGLFIMLTLFFCIRLTETGQTRDYVWVGLFAGLAVGTKYSAYVLVVPAALAHLLAWRRGHVQLLNPALLWMGVVAVLALFLTTPYAVLDNGQFMADLRYEWEHHKVLGHVGSEGGSGLWLLGQLLTRSDRWLTLLAGVGMGLALWRRHWPSLVVASFTIVYFATMATNLVRFERFLVPMIPALAVSAGYSVALLSNWLAGKRPYLWPLIMFPLLLEPMIGVMQFDSLLAQTEARTLARNWIIENIPPQSKLATERYAPNLDEADYQLRHLTSLNEHPAAWYRGQGFDYLIFAEAQYGIVWREPEQYADLIAAYETLWANFELVAQFEGPYVGRPNHHILIYRVTP